MLVNYFDRVNLSVSHVRSHYRIRNLRCGILGYLSGAYSWTYALFQLPIGVVLDKFGVRRVGRLGVALWSIASFGAAASPSIGGLFGARFLLGVGEAPTFPANAKAIGAWFPPHERSFATSLFDAAAKLASAIGVPVIGIFLIKAGWRWSFALTGVLSVLYLAYFWLVYKEPEEDPRLSEEERHYIEQAGREPEDSAADQIRRRRRCFILLPSARCWGLHLASAPTTMSSISLLTWLPSYLSFALHIDLLHSFLYTAVPWLFATFTDLAIGGWLVDTLVQRSKHASLVRRIVLIGGTAFGLGILVRPMRTTPRGALIWISISIGGLAAAAPCGLVGGLRLLHAATT